MPDLTGHVLKNRYRVDAYLGRGGMAEVYSAFDKKRNYKVAIKIMHPDLADDEEFVYRFQLEAKNLASLAHDNIVRFYSLEKDKGLTFLVMDYVDGVTLRTLIAQANGPMPLGQVAHIFGQMCQALHFAHEEGFVHRDVKPANIMIRPDGRVLVSDFGIAKASDAMTTTTFMPGTPAYMSPEQCRSAMVDRRSDVYSLGIVLYEMVTGRRPFLGQTESVTGGTREIVRWEQMNASPPPARQFNPNLPTAVDRVIMKALAKQPEGRFSSALGMLETLEIALGDISREVPVVAPQTTPIYQTGTLPSPVIEAVSGSVTSTPAQRFMKSAQSNPGLAAVAVVMILAIFVGAGWLFFGSDSPAPPRPTQSTVSNGDNDIDTLVTTTPQETEKAQAASARITCKSVHDGVEVREGPQDIYVAFASLKGNTVVEATGRNEKGTWWEIIHPEGPGGRGWVDVDEMELIEGEPGDLPLVTVQDPTPTPTATNTPTPTATPKPTKTPTPRPTPTPSLYASVNGDDEGGIHYLGSVEFCVWSTRTTAAEVSILTSGMLVAGNDFSNLTRQKECFSESIDRAGDYNLEVVARDKSGNLINTKIVNFEMAARPAPKPANFEVNVTVNGQCGGSVHVGSPVEICFFANRPAQAEAKVANFGTGQTFGQGNWNNLQKECIQGNMSLLPGKWTWTIDGRDSNGTFASKSCEVNVY